MTRCKYLEHLNLSGLDEHSTPADYNDLLHSAEVRSILIILAMVMVMVIMIMMIVTSNDIGEGALPEPDRGRGEGVAQPCQPQPWHPCQQWHP